MFDSLLNRLPPRIEIRSVPDDRQYVRLSPFILCCKRAFDLLVALLGLILLSPLFLLIAFLIKLDSPGPVFFSHLRVGRHRRCFRLWKFRKMHHDLPLPGPSLTKRYDGRLTSIGALTS
jgi:lipopolysaccharide/colanic/teichoic acid biosynthesis glycosyltransferase